MVGKAVFDEHLLDVHFTRSFYKHILGVKVTYHDIEVIDPNYFKKLKWMIENDISDFLDLTFSIDVDEEKLIPYERTEVPLERFSALQGISGSQKFQIHKAYGSPDHLPSAHTCFNQLDLTEYPSKQHLEERLLLAIHEANEGFGFG
ncbi:hypothetical protein ACH5RR_034770 [Cinchona calisaya]|uniref:HECT-type E3 ubiquitin transferase n=1 Tax=Cinchona calisaya TaxID=153742 RepID=A0ABD2YBV8_9GENT